MMCAWDDLQKCINCSNWATKTMTRQVRCRARPRRGVIGWGPESIAIVVDRGIGELPQSFPAAVPTN
jgi:hypothetical protein